MRNAILALLLGALLAGLAHADDQAEFKKRFSKLKKTEDGLADHMDLLEWCMQREMFKQAVQVGAQAEKIAPKDPFVVKAVAEARQMLKETMGQKGDEGDREPPKLKDPGLSPKTPKHFRGNQEKIRQYVDSVFAWGNKLWDAGKKEEALKYWDIIRKHYPGAQQVMIINMRIEQGDHKPKKGGGKKKGGNDFKAPPEWGDDDDDEKDEDEEESVGEAPKKGGDGDNDNVGGPPKKGGGDEDEDVGEAPVKPEITGGGKKPKKGGKEDEDEDEDEDKEQMLLDKKRKAEAKKHAKKFEIKSFRVGANVTFSGTYQQLELVFKNYSKPKYLTMVFYGLSTKGKIFRSERTFLGPEVNKRHAIVTAYKKEWAKEHGRLVVGRVEMWYGPRREKHLMLSADTDAKKRKKTKNADWYKPGIEDPTDRMGFYRPKQNNFESNTLKRIKRSYWKAK